MCVYVCGGIATIRSAMPAGNTVWTVARAAFIDLSKSREPANPAGQYALSFQLKDRIQAIKRDARVGVALID